jgi:predicted SAM-dependent methyltransferase
MRLNLGCGIFWAKGFLNIWIHDERQDEQWIDSLKSGAESLEYDLRKTPWPWPENSVDIIIESHWLGVAPTRLDIIKEAYKVLKPGGWFRMADSPDRYWEEGCNHREELEPHLKLITRARLVAELETMGFKVHTVDPSKTLIPESPEIQDAIIHNHQWHHSFVLECQK